MTPGSRSRLDHPNWSTVFGKLVRYFRNPALLARRSESVVSRLLLEAQLLKRTRLAGKSVSPAERHQIFWDSFAVEWDGRRTRQGTRKVVDEAMFQTILSQIESLRPSLVLDVGCNAGYLLAEVKRRLPGSRVCGFDISHAVLRRAQTNVADGCFVRGSGFALPFGTSTCDLVVHRGYLVNIPAPGANRAFREAIRVASRYVVFCEPMCDNGTYATTTAFSRYDGFYFHPYDDLIRREPGVQVVTRQRIEDGDARYYSVVNRTVGEYVWVLQKEQAQ